MSGPATLWAPPGPNGGWSDSEDGSEDDDDATKQARRDADAILAQEGDGAFTGHFWSVMVPTKPDPPTKELAERMARWGRPVSPFPREDSERSIEVAPAPAEAYPTPSATTPSASFDANLSMRSTHSNDSAPGAEADLSIASSLADGRPRMSTAEEDEAVLARYSSQPPQDERPPTPSAQQDDEVRQRYSEPPSHEEDGWDATARSQLYLPTQEEEEDERSILRDLSQGPESNEEDEEGELGPAPWTEHAHDASAPFVGLRGQDSEHEGQVHDNVSEGGSEEEEDILDPDLIQVSSKDPTAAARAAAILQMVRNILRSITCHLLTPECKIKYDYDCLPHIIKKRRLKHHSSASELVRVARRRGASSAGVGKAMKRVGQGHKRHHGATNAISEVVHVPGSPAPITVSNLLKEVTHELERDDSLSRASTVPPSDHHTTRASSRPPPTSQSPGVFDRSMAPPPETPARDSLPIAMWGDTPAPPPPAWAAFSLFSGTPAKRVQAASTPAMPASTAAPKSQPQPDGLMGPTVPQRRPWAKSDWKLLDACFTEERIEAARRAGMPEGEIADVDLVDMTDVVDRFLALPEMAGLWDRYVALVYVILLY
jgi:hypothetical protein